MIITIPKGKLMDESIKAFENAGFDLSISESRKLRIKNGDNEIIIARAMDVPFYVESYADLGICGTDVIKEKNCDVMMPLQLKFGKCRLSLCAPKKYKLKDLNGKKIATKYPNLTSKFFKSHGIDVKIVHLSGSIELAPVMGMADAIVDIVQTGETIRENGLVELKKVMDVSAALIVNRLSYKIKFDEIRRIMDNMEVFNYEYE